MNGPDGPDWGSMDPPATVATAGRYRVEDATFDQVVDVWPAQKPAARRRPVDVARGELIDHPGQIRRLGWEFDDVGAASDMAAQFAEVDPSELDPDATGFFEAVPVRASPAEPWRIIARYVQPDPTLFPDFQTWMVEWLAPIIRRPLRGGVLWCPEWWRHPEAVVRLDALWRAWESARAEGGSGMAHWWDMHFDSHWSVLTSDRGPFAACKEKVHAAAEKQLDMLPCDPPPEDWSWPSDPEVHA